MAHSKRCSQEVPFSSFLFNPLPALRLLAVLWPEVGKPGVHAPQVLPAGPFQPDPAQEGFKQRWILSSPDSLTTGWRCRSGCREADKSQVILAEMNSWLWGQKQGAQTPGGQARHVERRHYPGHRYSMALGPWRPSVG